MEIKPPNRAIPERLEETVRNLDTEGLVALYIGNYEKAAILFREQYELLFKAQEQENRPIHKGGSLHNRGVALFSLGQVNEAIHSILLAYVEDTLNVGYDLEDNADRAPAARMLRDVFYFRLRILREIKTIAAKIKASSEWNMARDPETILKKAAKSLKFDVNNLKEQCERGIPQRGKMLLGFPQPRERRVFVGTNYDVNPGVIPIVKEGVVRKGYVPIVVLEVGLPPNMIHDGSLLLLHTCGYAVFDVTHPGGQFMEVERARDYGVNVLLVRSALDPSKPPSVSQMISTLGYRIEYYFDPRDLIPIVMKFLP